jgi:phosphoglycerate dehydrogenase-like enzyme
MKIIVLSPNIDKLFGPDLLAQVKAAGELVVVRDTKPLSEVAELYEGDEPRLLAIDPDFCDWQVPNEVIDKVPNLQAICLQTTSFSWVDVEYAKQKDIPVMDLRGFSSIAVAEWVVFMTLAVARKLPIVVRDEWKLDYERHQGLELRGKTAGVIGLGNIGTAIAENFAGLGMKVQYWSKHSEDERFTKVPLDELMRTSDAIVPALAINEGTKGLLTDDMLRSLKPTALLVSILDPGAVYNHALLLELAAGGKVGGYAFEDEKGPFGKYDGNVWNGPALGWCTQESMTKNAKQWVESIVLAAKGEYPTRVN